MASNQIRVGMRIPVMPLAQLSANNAIATHDSDFLLDGAKVLVVGVPGAFTPTCSTEHLPPIIKSADRLRDAGFTDLFCVVTSDPFATAAWSKQIDPAGYLRFVSDGNLDFARACGLLTQERGFFLGHRSRRYTMILQKGFVAKLNVETSVINVTCTRAEALFDDAPAR